MIKLVVGKTIEVSNMPTKVIDALKKSLTIENKDFFKFQKRGIWAPRDFKYWKALGTDGLIIPRGCLTRLKRYLESLKLAYSLVDNTVDKSAKATESTLVPRDYQVPLIRAFALDKPTEGLLVSSTGSGKTIMALEVIHRLKLTATILVTNTVLADQFASDAKRFYGIEASRIDSKHKEVGDITIATFQSLFGNDELLAKLSANTSVLVVDEAQGICSSERERVLKEFRPKHIMGLTATPERTDSLTPAIFFLLGEIIAEHQMEQAQPLVEVIMTKTPIEMSDTYNDIIVSMVQNKNRNKLIASLALLESMAGRKVLVLTKRIEHYSTIRDEHFKDMPGFYFIDSEDEGRNELLSKLKSGEEQFSCIFGTTSLLAVGTDIPSLDLLIIACDIKSTVLTTQSVGRILRLFEGKPNPRIIDLYDNENPILASQFKSRLELYQRKGWEILHYFKCRKCTKTFSYYRKDYLPHNKLCYGNKN